MKLTIKLYLTVRNVGYKLQFFQDLTFTGCCFNCNMIERMRETSLDVLLDLGLKSHNLAIRSHSVPGSIAPASATNCFSAFLI